LEPGDEAFRQDIKELVDQLTAKASEPAQLREMISWFAHTTSNSPSSLSTGFNTGKPQGQ
jgi:hypothetical protein